MKTKVVYVLTSSTADTYLEQMWISIYSLRLVQSDVYIHVLMDRQTADTLIGTRKGWLNLVNEISTIDCPQEYNSLYRSRYIRTKLRHLISGDYLVVDNDTVFGESISDIDYAKGSVCGVLDYALSSLKRGSTSYKRAEFLGWEAHIGEKPYINPGVLYVKDNSEARTFYNYWYDYWNECAQKGLHYDQLAFSMAKLDTDEIVQILPETWNYQIKGMPLGTKYKSAKVYHYFSSVPISKWPMTMLETPFVYSHIREFGEIPQALRDILVEPLSLFQNRIVTLSIQQQEQLELPIFKFLKYHSKIRLILNSLVSLVLRI